MANTYFRFKQFTVQQEACAMKVTTDACLFGAWSAAAMSTQNAAGKTLLDIGTGTGLLSLMIRQKNNLEIEAVEIDAAATAQAKENVTASPWPESMQVHQGDILNMGILKSYDYIISNPPFYEKELKSTDSKRNTAHHSHQLTLQALLSFIATHLKADGQFFLLLPYKRRNEVQALLQKNQLLIYTEAIVQQTPTHTPFRIMLQGGFEQAACKTNPIIIAESNQQYTPEFKTLLKDYYLYL